MTVSVLINNYNYGRFLDECLLSLKNQTVKPDEVILYDDGSTDNSLEIASKYGFVQVISNPNFGKKPSFNQANGINKAFGRSTGDIICLLDSDDFFHPNKIETIKKIFNLNKVVLVQHAYFEWVNNKITRVINYGKANCDYLQLYKTKNCTSFFNPTSTFCFSRDYLNNRLPLSLDGDWRVWPDVRLSRIAPYYGKVVSLNEPLSYYRRHQNSDSVFMNRNAKKTLENGIAHHYFINEQLKALNKPLINYKKSFVFFKSKLKTVLPPLLVRILIWLNNKT